MIHPELMPFLKADTLKRKVLGLCTMVGFGLFAVAFVAMAIASRSAEPLLPAVIVALPALMGFVVFLLHRKPERTPVGKAILQGGEGLRTFYPQKTRVHAAGLRVADLYELVFERTSGKPVKWLLRREQLGRVYQLLQQAMPSVPAEPLPF